MSTSKQAFRSISSLAVLFFLCQTAVAQTSAVVLPLAEIQVTAATAWEVDLADHAASPGATVAPWEAREDWFLEALDKGTILRTERIGHGVTNPYKAEIEYDDQRLFAVWKPLRNTDFTEHETYEAEVAAYRLSRHLGLDMVPPTVKRKIGRRWGSLQLWVDGHAMFSEVMDERPVDFLVSDQYQLMRLFDAIIDNPDRNAGNFLVDDDWSIVLIDHSRAMDFAHKGRKREGAMPHRFQRSVVERLRALDQDRLHALLGDLYHKGELKILHGSVRRVVRFVEDEAEVHGPAVVFFDSVRPAVGANDTLQARMSYPTEEP